MTLTEVLVTLAITGLMAGMIGTVVYRIRHVVAQGNNQLRVQHDLQNAAIWLNRDVPGGSPPAAINGTHMVLTYHDLMNSSTHAITYTLASPNLVRSLSNGSTLAVARHVVSATFTSPMSSCVLITITSEAGDVTGSASLRLDMRPNQ
jgi:ABC-type Fe3+-siderophore transport system permease subunit